MSTLAKLRVAFLWHQHQPDYKLGDRFLLPWTRLHAVKDYLDITVRALEQFPKIRQTINVVPSLLLQLTDYAMHNGTDEVLLLSERPAAELTAGEKRRILESFFLCNAPNMIAPYPRYRELFERAGGDPKNESLLQHAAGQFSVQDWLDLQVWYNLTWIGPYSRTEEPFASLFQKGHDFTERDKAELLDASSRLLASVIPAFRRLMESGQIELSVTPMYHPILPLLCNSDSARPSMPETPLPDPPIRLSQDAAWHISEAVDTFRRYFDTMPAGMWPSEGSVSTEVMQLIAASGLVWTATDEGILRNTLGEACRDYDKFFPYTVETPAGPLWTVFRDHGLSDAIGFEYAGREPAEAARDFMKRLLDIRDFLEGELGTDGISQALVPVILDGENCWEYYRDNGRPFLEALYRLLSDSGEIECVSVGEGLHGRQPDPERTIREIFPGSWINSNFQIWIGDSEDIVAWESIAHARVALMAAKPGIPADAFGEAMRHIHVAQGSDWFWWYGPENNSSNDEEFDILFRTHLTEVYRIIGRLPPPEIASPIASPRGRQHGSGSTGAMHRAE